MFLYGYFTLIFLCVAHVLRDHYTLPAGKQNGLCAEFFKGPTLVLSLSHDTLCDRNIGVLFYVLATFVRVCMPTPTKQFVTRRLSEKLTNGVILRYIINHKCRTSLHYLGPAT